MPRYLDMEPPKSVAAQTWQTLFKKAILKRYRPEELAKAFRELQMRYRTRSGDIATTLLGFRAANGNPDDVLVFKYAEFLLKNDYFTASDLLSALLKSSSYVRSKTSPNTKFSMPTCEERIFMIITQFHITSDLPSSAVALQDLVFIIYRWLKVVGEDVVGKQLSGLQTMDAQLNGIYEALAQLTLATLGNKGMRKVTQYRWWKERRATVVNEMQNYDVNVLQWMNSQLAGRLRALLNVPPYLEMDADGKYKFSDEQILAQVEELPVVRSRAGIFVWLNAALAARPLTDDMTILTYIQGRSSDNPQSIVVDLLVAAFDVLTNFMLTKEPRQNAKVVRSFICNKLPVLIAILANNMQPAISADACIQMALMPGGMISMDPLPPISAGATDVRDSLKTTRLEFLQACVLHGLVNEQTVALILQESVALPRVIKLNKDSLVAQCANNVSKLAEHIEELAGMQGNVGAIAGCVVETVNNMCMSKDTMSLKSVCDKLIRRIPYMDFVMQYTQPGMLLLPLCNLLNDWTHDQDQSEFTPAYEEFASILLFTLAVIYRYDLSFADIGILGDSFIARLLEDMTVSKPPGELQSEQASQLTQWIEGLFAVDEHGDTSGIGDEVMRQCSPQSFYTLVPTLFEQSILACRSQVLSMNTFKSGLELLLEPFLLPSLVMGLGWLAKHSWEDHNDADVLIQVLEKLLNPSSNAPETQAMHRAVLAMVATPLYCSLEEYCRKQPNKKANELLELLKPHLNQQRSLHSRQSELDQWQQDEKGLQGRVQQAIRELIAWSSTSTSPPNPPPHYTHRTFAIACQLLDSQTLLDAIIAEVNKTEYNNVPIALDVCTSLICAPAPVPMGAQQATHWTSPTGQLRSRVRIASGDAQAILDLAKSYAETLVRLGRRVQAQMSFAAQMPAIAMPMPMQDQSTDQMMQDLGLALDNNTSASNVDATMATNASAMASNAEMSGMDQPIDLTNLNNASADELAKLTVDGDAMNLDQNNQFLADFGMGVGDAQNNAQNNAMTNQDDDIFAGLNMDMGELDDFTFD
ncbi:hypothetical protein CKM354_000742900 [Cercospora kikuchii]|uniref:Mediator of RNA polymerase II transcription subunit 5 n=1 Tax=Cercospora kikuchii TaxID=84275 RepID=A0A9P3CPG0_9PEZI|nr:uncharacterized protein CKM354_000742900 [Cercospora kikuchii]GIZ44225.1 hypothetical protein CKM354_000742900 [Cercospora kikuchii]